MPVIASVTEIQGKKTTLYIEAERLPEDAEVKRNFEHTLGSRPDVLGQVKDVFEDGLDIVVQCAKKAAHTIANIAADERPNDFEIELSVKLDSEVGAVLAKAKAGAHMTVKLRWSDCPQTSVVPPSQDNNNE